MFFDEVQTWQKHKRSSEYSEPMIWERRAEFRLILLVIGWSELSGT